VDGTDLASLPRRLIRQRCFITITQDPFLQPGATLRLNLDPSGLLPREALTTALRKTGLWAVFSSAAAAASSPDDDDDDDDDDQLFDSKLSSLPALSGGQAQLLALTRALLQKQAVAEVPSTADLADYPGRPLRKPILLLDEATSSLDPETEAAVYDVIQDEFISAGHTVIMVTHKLGMFADRMRPSQDKIVWMKDGRIERVGEVGDLVDLTNVPSSPGSDSP